MASCLGGITCDAQGRIGEEMSENSKIEWTDHTFNGWEGCQPVGPGCDHCYAEARNARFSGGVAINWGPGAPRRRTSAANWKKPIQWNAAHAAFFAEHGRRQRVFCSSLADVFDNEVSAQWRFDLMKLIEQTPNLDWLLLTKRIGNAATMLEQSVRAINAGRWGWADNVFPNVWIGATIVNQEEADRDIPKLLRTPAAKRFLSMEPLLGPVDLRFTNGLVHGCDAADYLLDWVIVGGESGQHARPMHPAWPRAIEKQCQDAGVPFLFKQWGEWLPWLEFSRAGIDDDIEQTRYLTTIWQDDHFENCGYPIWCDMRDNYGGGANGPDEPDQIMGRVGKKAAGRLLDGVLRDGYPKGPA